MPTQNILYPSHTVIPQNCFVISTALATKKKTLCQFSITDDPLVYCDKIQTRYTKMFISRSVGRLQQDFTICCLKANCQVASKQHITLSGSAACTRMGQVFLLCMYDLQKNKRTQKNLNIFLSWALMGFNSMLSFKKVTKFLFKISQFQFLVLAEKNIFVYQCFCH